LVVQSAGCITGVDHQAEPGKAGYSGWVTRLKDKKKKI